MSKSPEQLLKELEKLKEEIKPAKKNKVNLSDLEQEKKELETGIERARLKKQISKLKMQKFLINMGLKK